MTGAVVIMSSCSDRGRDLDHALGNRCARDAKQSSSALPQGVDSRLLGNAVQSPVSPPGSRLFLACIAWAACCGLPAGAAGCSRAKSAAYTPAPQVPAFDLDAAVAGPSEAGAIPSTTPTAASAVDDRRCGSTTCPATAKEFQCCDGGGGFVPFCCPTETTCGYQGRCASPEASSSSAAPSTRGAMR